MILEADDKIKIFYKLFGEQFITNLKLYLLKSQKDFNLVEINKTNYYILTDKNNSFKLIFDKKTKAVIFTIQPIYQDLTFIKYLRFNYDYFLLFLKNNNIY